MVLLEAVLRIGEEREGGEEPQDAHYAEPRHKRLDLLTGNFGL